MKEGRRKKEGKDIEVIKNIHIWLSSIEKVVRIFSLFLSLMNSSSSSLFHFV